MVAEYELGPNDEPVNRVVKQVVYYAIEDGADAIAIYFDTNCARVSYRLRRDGMLHETMRLPAHYIRPLTARFHQIVSDTGPLLIRWQAEEQPSGLEHYSVVDYHVTLTIEKEEQDKQVILGLESTCEQSIIVLPADDVLHVSEAMGWDIHQTKAFLAMASPLFYSRFVTAVRSGKKGGDEYFYDLPEDHDELFDLYDPLEDDPDYAEYLRRATKEAAEELRGEGMDGEACPFFWDTKKRILREKYRIEWFTPLEMNPNYHVAI